MKSEFTRCEDGTLIITLQPETSWDRFVLLDRRAEIEEKERGERNTYPIYLGLYTPLPPVTREAWELMRRVDDKVPEWEEIHGS